MNTNDPVYIDPYDEGYQAAREGRVNAAILALPAQMMGDQLTYSGHDSFETRLSFVSNGDRLNMGVGLIETAFLATEEPNIQQTLGAAMVLLKDFQRIHALHDSQQNQGLE